MDSNLRLILKWLVFTSIGIVVLFSGFLLWRDTVIQKKKIEAVEEIKEPDEIKESEETESSSTDDEMLRKVTKMMDVYIPNSSVLINPPRVCHTVYKQLDQPRNKDNTVSPSWIDLIQDQRKLESETPKMIQDVELQKINHIIELYLGIKTGKFPKWPKRTSIPLPKYG